MVSSVDDLEKDKLKCTESFDEIELFLRKVDLLRRKHSVKTHFLPRGKYSPLLRFKTPFLFDKQPVTSTPCEPSDMLKKRVNFKVKNANQSHASTLLSLRTRVRISPFVYPAFFKQFVLVNKQNLLNIISLIRSHHAASSTYRMREESEQDPTLRATHKTMHILHHEHAYKLSMLIYYARYNYTLRVNWASIFPFYIKTGIEAHYETYVDFVNSLLAKIPSRLPLKVDKDIKKMEKKYFDNVRYIESLL